MLLLRILVHIQHARKNRKKTPTIFPQPNPSLQDMQDITKTYENAYDNKNAIIFNSLQPSNSFYSLAGLIYLIRFERTAAKEKLAIGWQSYDRTENLVNRSIYDEDITNINHILETFRGKGVQKQKKFHGYTINVWQQLGKITPGPSVLKKKLLVYRV